MKLKYYHGTSSIFLNSIIKFGLGGINPNIKYKNLELLKYLSKESERKISNKPEYLNVRNAILGMANQKSVELEISNGEKFIANYEHSRIYVGMTLERALIYACDNKFGSEILEHCILLFKLLKKNDSNFHLPPELNLFNIEKYIDKEFKPILIEIDGINSEELETEFGKNGTEYIINLKKILPNLSKTESIRKLAYSNFRLLKPIGIKRMKIYEVDFEGKVGTPQFDFTMSEIKACT
jgi:hypothetical protein